MLDVPLGEGANIFIWGFCILMAFVNALLLINTLKTQQRHKKETALRQQAQEDHGEKREVIL